jgi:hypothetical protein
MAGGGGEAGKNMVGKIMNVIEGRGRKEGGKERGKEGRKGGRGREKRYGKIENGSERERKKREGEGW